MTNYVVESRFRQYLPQVTLICAFVCNWRPAKDTDLTAITIYRYRLQNVKPKIQLYRKDFLLKPNPANAICFNLMAFFGNEFTKRKNGLTIFINNIAILKRK